MKRSIWITFFSLALTCGYNHVPKTTASEIGSVASNSCVVVGRFISIQGKVQLKRQEWSDYHPVTVGTVLCVGDSLRSPKDVRAVVHCVAPDQDFWTVPDGMVSSAVNGCRPPKEPIHTITGPLIPTRDPLARNIPYIVSPHRTWLLNDKPKLRWQAVSGATSYVVRVIGPGVNWVTEVSTTEVVYPGELPLKPVAEGYLLVVEADNGASPAKATFALLDSNKVTRVRAAAERISKQNLSGDEKALALGDLYVGKGLIAQATEVLEAAAAKGSQTAAVYYMLGDLYARGELFSQVQENYLKAFQLARTAKDIEGQAAAAARLGEFYKALGKPDQASSWLKEAKEKYKLLKPISH